MHILLFDIDGTLIRSGGAGKVAMESALQETFQLVEIQDRVNYSGRTDSSIAFDLLTVHGIEPSRTHIELLTQAYLQRLPQALQRNQGVVLPGVSALLNELQTIDHLALGLLTGNIQAGAELKLRHFALWDYFAFGGFADGIHDRDDVARHALKQTENHLQRKVEPDSVWVIGDTPMDVKCARAIGAKAVAVTTGWHSKDELHASQPDFLLSDLREIDVLLQIWRTPYRDSPSPT